MDDTKDYIINLRVSRKTYEKIKQKARKNGGSVSELVRSIINDSAEIISDLSRDFQGGKRRKFDDIMSYHRGTLAQPRACDGCGAEMKRDQVVTIGETASGSSYYFCDSCR